MNAKLTFLAGLAVGYVFGTKAGRESYENLKKSIKSMMAAEPVQDAVSTVQHAVKEQVQDATEKAAEKLDMHAQKSPSENRSSSAAEDPLGHVKPSDVRRDISPKVSDEFPDAALKGGEGQHWEH